MIRLVRAWLRAKIQEHFAPESSSELGAIIEHAVVERAAAIIKQECVPTINDAWACMDCGAIQSAQKRPRSIHKHGCVVCGRHQLVSLLLQLQRGSQRIARRRAELAKARR
jgi:hypothetical protein